MGNGGTQLGMRARSIQNRTRGNWRHDFSGSNVLLCAEGSVGGIQTADAEGDASDGRTSSHRVWTERMPLLSRPDAPHRVRSDPPAERGSSSARTTSGVSLWWWTSVETVCEQEANMAVAKLLYQSSRSDISDHTAPSYYIRAVGQISLSSDHTALIYSTVYILIA